MSVRISRTIAALGTLAAVLLASCASPGASPEAPAPVPAAAPAPPAATPAPQPRPGDTRPEIHEDDLRLRIGLLAHDSMAGRETGTREKELAGDYLAAEAARLGLVPGGEDGTFFQTVPLERRITRVALDHRTAAGPGGNGADATSGGATAEAGTSASPLGLDDLAFVSGVAGLPATTRTQGEGRVVWGGHLFDPSLPPGALTFQELDGAVVIVSMEPAPGVEGDPSTLPPRMEVAILFGPQSPASAVVIVADGDLDDFWDYALDIGRKGAVSLRGGEEPTDAPPFFLMHPDALDRLLGGPAAENTRPVTDLGTLAFSLEHAVESFEDRNVIAIVPGADPELAGEFMTLGAHYDHTGIGTPVDGDSIYNGADDNASGTSALLEVAEYLAHLPEADRPRRSILFTWHAAEESGLLGSEYFTDFPTVSRDQMVAHINLDMVGRNHPDSLFLVGTRRLSTEYGEWVEAANAALERPFVLDYEYDTPGHPEQLYCRSDHWNFARYGIPVAKIGSGLHDDYHKPSDTVDLIEYGKVARVAHFATEITLRVANAPQRPAIDGPIPDPQAPCQG